jgi:hypothetical protein
MECDYTHLNHNSLVSQKKVVTKGVIIKGVYYINIMHILYNCDKLDGLKGQQTEELQTKLSW